MRRYILAILGLGSAVSGSIARRQVFSWDMSRCILGLGSARVSCFSLSSLSCWPPRARATRKTARLGGRTPIESTLIIGQLLSDPTCGLWKRWRHVGNTVTHELRVSETVRDSRLRVPAHALSSLFSLSLKSSSLTEFTTT